MPGIFFLRERAGGPQGSGVSFVLERRDMDAVVFFVYKLHLPVGQPMLRNPIPFFEPHPYVCSNCPILHGGFLFQRATWIKRMDNLASHV